MSLFTRNRKKAREEREVLYGRVTENNKHVEYVGKLLEYAPDRTADNTCSLCKKWEPGDTWQSGKFGIEAEGTCTGGDFPCWNYRLACKNNFEKQKRTGFIYHGGNKPIAEEIEEVMEIVEELIKDNE